MVREHISTRDRPSRRARQNGLRALDALDRRTLALLQRNARLSNAEIGRRIGLSGPAVAQRVARLEQTGVVGGYRALLDPRAIGFGVVAFVSLKETRADSEVVAALEKMPEIVECNRVVGPRGFFLKVAARDVSHLDNLLSEIARYGKPSSAVLLSTPFTRGFPLS